VRRQPKALIAPCALDLDEAELDEPLEHVPDFACAHTMPDREIAWTIEGQIKPPIGHIYGYRLEPLDGGTMVTSYYDWTDIHDDWKKAGVFPVLQEVNLRATLGILARTVAPGQPRPGA